jgi:hypothetical protein
LGPRDDAVIACTGGYFLETGVHEWTVPCNTTYLPTETWLGLSNPDVIMESHVEIGTHRIVDPENTVDEAGFAGTTYTVLINCHRSEK